MASVRKKMKCVVHYQHLKPPPHIVPLNDHKFNVLKSNVLARRKLGGLDEHSEQCAMVPLIFDPGIHGTHSKCYNNFTKGTSIARKRGLVLEEGNEESGPSSRQRVKRSGEGGGTLFPEYCMFCKRSDAIQVNYTKQWPHKLECKGADAKIVEAAKYKNDEQLLPLIQGEKLYEREFKCHDKCYREYTRPIYSHKVSDDKQKGSLEEFIRKEVVDRKNAVSLAEIAEMCGEDQNDRKKRQRLKEKILQLFPDLTFFSAGPTSPQIVVSSLQNLTGANIRRIQKDESIRAVAHELRKDIINLIENASPLPWPPTSDDLTSKDREAPASVTMFLRHLLQEDHHTTTDTTESHIWSFSQDLLHSVSRGSYLTAKHPLVASAIHTLTGQKVPIQILSKLGNCSTYPTLQKLETGQAELSQHKIEMNNPLPVRAIDSKSPILTHFWWDNFDCKKENLQGSIHTTHGIAFQELSPHAFIDDKGNSITSSGRRSLVPTEVNITPINVNPKNPPRPFRDDFIDNKVIDTEEFVKILTLWKLARRIHTGDKQLIPRFVGQVIQILQKKDTKTVITFLPPICKPITDFGTVCETIHRSIRLSKLANMLYTHVTVDIGAVEKYYKVKWNNPEKFEKVLIHLGDFHGIMHFFGNVGKFVTCSGFEDVVYQAGMCSSGGIKKVLSGKAYNSCWRIHEVFAEAIFRLFEKRYVLTSLPNKTRLERIVKENVKETQILLSNTDFERYNIALQEARQRALSGEFGCTPQYWMIYQEMVDLIHQLHYAINTNNFDLRLSSWERLLQLSFVMNKQNYSRFGTFYVLQLRSLGKTHPGALEELKEKGLSVCRNNVGIRQSIDGAGEQTFMKSSKTAGGIKNSVCQQATYEKWVLSRPGQAEYLNAIKEKVGVSKNMEARKCLRPSEIKSHEKAVMKVVDVLENDFIDPFSSDLEDSALYNLSSGKVVHEDVKTCLLSVFERGQKRMDDFVSILKGNEKSKHLFTSISQRQWNSFESAVLKAKIVSNGKTTDISLQRDILGVLAAKSDLENASVDINKALQYPLAPVSLPLANADGGMRKTNKSKLYESLESLEKKDGSRLSDSKNYYIIDLAATLRATVSVPDTFEDLAIKLLKDIPDACTIVYFACDTYLSDTIKGSERKKRGDSEVLLLRSSKMKTPRDFQNFLNNGTNKERLFELIEDTFINRKNELDGRTIYFARKDKCTRITSTSADNVMSVNHEEADTKVVALVKHANETHGTTNARFIVKSSSGDIDIPIIFLSLSLNLDIVIDSGRSNARKLLFLKQCTLTDEQKNALVGFHAFTGCDQNSSFFRKGKKKCWKIAQKFLKTFCSLGVSYEVDEHLCQDLEGFVCKLYGGKDADVNELRTVIFWKVLKNKNRIVDLSLLPPCRLSLMLHIKRSNYIARIWRQAEEIAMEIQDPRKHGWNNDLSLRWPEMVLPEDLIKFIDVEEAEPETDSEDEVSDYSDDEDEY